MKTQFARSSARPVDCRICGGQMFYLGHPYHVPEVRVIVDDFESKETFYAHTECWNSLMDKVFGQKMKIRKQSLDKIFKEV